MSMASRGSAGGLDWRAIKGRVGLEAAAVAVLGPPQASRGGKRLWRCPFHDDHDPSLEVDPARGRWKCWPCNLGGDAADLVRRVNRSSFPEAVRFLAGLSGVGAGAGDGEGPRRPPRRPPDGPALVEEAVRRLWGAEGAGALGYLRGRGLADATIREARLGASRDGVTIPWFDGPRLALLKVRRPEGRKPKYIESHRDRPTVYPGPGSIRPGVPLVIAEGEFDALLLGQELGGRASAATLGSASTAADPAAVAALLRASRWYVALDADPAGDRSAAAWPPRAIRVRPPAPHNDWTDLHRDDPAALARFWGDVLASTGPVGYP